jgi:hypothetical protein
MEELIEKDKEINLKVWQDSVFKSMSAGGITHRLSSSSRVELVCAH